MHPLELSGADLRDMLRRTADKLAPFLDSLPQQPVSNTEGGRKLARRLMEPCPETGVPFSRLLAQITDQIVPTSLNTASPGYLAFIPGGGLPHAAVADLITGVTNRFTGIWMPAPGLVQTEIAVLRWMCGWVGYGSEAGGTLTSGGSLATLSAFVAARERGFRRVYTTELVHHCAAKAARIADMPVTIVPMDSEHRMRPDAIGDEPGVVIASAGTTALGNVDPIAELADSCEGRHWFHVDGAYGGCFVLTERGRRALAGIERADSILLDPHKGLFLPYGTGALLVKDRSALREAFRSEASYLPDPVDGDDFWDFTDLGPELSRPTRGLRLWLPLKMHGVGAFRDALDEKLDLAEDAARRVAALPHVRMVAGPDLSLFAFRIEPPGHPDHDGLTRRVLARVNQKQRVFLTGATVGGAFVGRVCVLSFRTHQDRIDALVADLAEAIADPRG
ncbi:MAG: decarboxylase [Proteobacteria bacterium]|nr:decarboxylase [Pseudomonadota bacterium]MCP4921079.1 decarboxylase [Pseudomonadota bacterium]